MRNMTSDRFVTMKYLADLAGVDADTVRRYVRALSPLAGDHGPPTAREGSAGE